MITCNLCKSAMGDVVEGKRIQPASHGICTVCMEELEKLEERYRGDFEARSGQAIRWIVPWPAFKEFSWPPYSAVIVSGWQFHKHEFGMAFTEEIVVAGRRSIQSFEEEALSTMRDLNEKLERAESPGNRMVIRREIQKWQQRLDKVEELLRQGERSLYMIPLDRIRSVLREESEDWIKIRLRFTIMKDKFLGGKKEAEAEEYFTFSSLYKEAADFLSQKVDGLGGTVEIVQVQDQK